MATISVTKCEFCGYDLYDRTAHQWITVNDRGGSKRIALCLNSKSGMNNASSTKLLTTLETESAKPSAAASSSPSVPSTVRSVTSMFSTPTSVSSGSVSSAKLLETLDSQPSVLPSSSPRSDEFFGNRMLPGKYSWPATLTHFDDLVNMPPEVINEMLDTVERTLQKVKTAVQRRRSSYGSKKKNELLGELVQAYDILLNLSFLFHLQSLYMNSPIKNGNHAHWEHIKRFNQQLMLFSQLTEALRENKNHPSFINAHPAVNPFLQLNLGSFPKKEDFEQNPRLVEQIATKGNFPLAVYDFALKYLTENEASLRKHYLNSKFKTETEKNAAKIADLDKNYVEDLRTTLIKRKNKAKVMLFRNNKHLLSLALTKLINKVEDREIEQDPTEYLLNMVESYFSSTSTEKKPLFMVFQNTSALTARFLLEFFKNTVGVESASLSLKVLNKRLKALRNTTMTDNEAYNNLIAEGLAKKIQNQLVFQAKATYPEMPLVLHVTDFTSKSWPYLLSALKQLPKELQDRLVVVASTPRSNLKYLHDSAITNASIRLFEWKPFTSPQNLKLYVNTMLEHPPPMNLVHAAIDFLYFLNTLKRTNSSQILFQNADRLLQVEFVNKTFIPLCQNLAYKFNSYKNQPERQKMAINNFFNALGIEMLKTLFPSVLKLQTMTPNTFEQKLLTSNPNSLIKRLKNGKKISIFLHNLNLLKKKLLN